MDGQRSRQCILSLLSLTLLGLRATAGIASAHADEVTDWNSTVSGITQGEQIGRQAFAQYLQPYRP